MTTERPWALEAEGLVQRYFDEKLGRERTVLNGLDLRLRAGEFCCVVGPSGCGKSTFLRLVLGSEKPKGGTLRLFGKEPGPPNRDRGIVYQRYSLFPNLRVIENVIFGLELDEVDFLMKYLWYPGFLRTHRKFVELGLHYLEKVGLAEHAWKYPFQLSGGQQQRVAIAQALIMNPKILLMDEPFGALDPGTRAQLQQWLMEIQEREKCTIFFVTHDLEEAVFLSTRLLVLSQYYEHAPGDEGARIVGDIAPPPVEKSALKDDPRFMQVVQQVLHVGFDREHLQPESEFVSTHPDACKGVAP